MMYNPIVANTNRLIPNWNLLFIFHWHLNRCMKFWLFLTFVHVPKPDHLSYNLCEFETTTNNNQNKWLVESTTTVTHQLLLQLTILFNLYAIVVRCQCSTFLYLYLPMHLPNTQLFLIRPCCPSFDAILTNDCAWTMLSTTDSLFITTYLA